MAGIMQVMASSVRSSIPQPLLYLDALDYAGSGATWDASVGSNATLINTPSFTGAAPTYFTFSPASSEYASGPDLGTMSHWTIECWFRVTSSYTSTYTGLITDRYDGSSKLNYSMSFNPNGYSGTLQVGFFNGAWHLTSGFSPTLNTWYHCVGTYDGNTIVQYVNGVVQSQLSYSGVTNSSGLGYRVGARWDTQVAPNDFFPGDISIVRVWNSALSAQQVANLYAQNSARYSNSVVTSGLVGYWDPHIRASYGGTGTTINDLSSNGLNGTMSNITYTSPYFTYNGTNSQVNIADNAALEPGSGSWTMEAWVYQTAPGNDVVLGKFDPGGLSSDVSYSIRSTSSTLYAQLGNGSGGYINSSNYSVTLNTWYQIVYVFTNGATKTLETYANGASIGTVSHTLASILNTSANLYIGSYNDGEYSQWWTGRIGIVRLYNRALTSSEVLQNWNSNRGVYGL